MISYLLKTSIFQFFVLVLYFIFLRKNSSFSFNRFFLLGALLFSFLVPSLRFNFATFIKTPALNQPLSLNYNLPEINIYAYNGNTISFSFLIYAVVGLVSFYFLIKWFINIIALLQIHKFAKTSDIYTNTYLVENINIPFSFINKIYIPNNYENIKELNAIILHEQEHIRKKHSWDKIILSLLQSLLWFNPFIYIFHKEIETLHEYEADAKSVNSIGEENYLQCILQTFIYTQTTKNPLSSSFFSNNLKSRISMLNKKTKFNIMKNTLAMTILGIFALSFLYFQSEAQTQKTKVKKKDKYLQTKTLSDTVFVEDPTNGSIKMMIVDKEIEYYTIAEKMPEFKGGIDNLPKYLSMNIQYPEFARENNIAGRVIVQFIVNEEGGIEDAQIINHKAGMEALENEALRVVRGMPAWTPGMHKGKKVGVQYTLPINFSLDK